EVERLCWVAVKKKGRAAFRSLRLARRGMIQADQADLAELTHAIRMVPMSRPAVPDRVAVEVAADQRVLPKSGAVALQILPELANIGIGRRRDRLCPDREQIASAADPDRQEMPQAVTVPVLRLD